MTRDEINDLAAKHYPDYDPGADRLFALLVVVADAYLHELEQKAGDDPAPFLFGATPLDCLLQGLRENLEAMRGY